LKKLYNEELDFKYKNSLQNKLKTNLNIENFDNNNITTTNTANTYNNESVILSNDTKPKEVINVNSENNVIQASISTKLQNISKKKIENPYSKYVNQKASFIPIYINKKVIKKS